jgi:hypothetical protein
MTSTSPNLDWMYLFFIIFTHTAVVVVIFLLFIHLGSLLVDFSHIFGCKISWFPPDLTVVFCRWMNFLTFFTSQNDGEGSMNASVCIFCYFSTSKHPNFGALFSYFYIDRCNFFTEKRWQMHLLSVLFLSGFVIHRCGCIFRIFLSSGAR